MSSSVVATFNTRLESVCRQRQSNLCVGLDPDIQRIKTLSEDWNADSVSEQAMRTMLTAVSAAAGYAAAFKPNAAFYEAIENETPLTATIGHHLAENFPDVLAIIDGKRGDIGNTSARYATAAFEVQKFDCITVNPLMGHDAVEPFLRNPAKGVFLLCLTSNPGADDFLMQGDLYLRIAEKAMEWNANQNIGLVVGATRPEYLARIRKVAPDLPFLIPGIGAQGGKLDETLDAIGAGKNRRFLINASRSVLYPPDATWENYAVKVGEAARKLRDDINTTLKQL